MSALVRPTGVGQGGRALFARPPLAGPGQAAAGLLAGARWAGIGSALVLLATQLLAPATLALLAPWLAVAGLLVGLPHGAVDHLTPFWLAGRPGPVGRGEHRTLLLVLGGYLGVAGAAGLVLVLAPTAAVLIFLLASALHFGFGETGWAEQAAGRALPPARRAALRALAHGAVVVGLPVALWPQVSLPVLGLLAPALAHPPAAALRGLLVATVLLVAGAAVEQLRRGRFAELGELAVLAALFWVVPPMAAFGVYFGLWHSLRHTARLLALADPGPTWCLRAAGRRFAAQALAPTLVAVVLLATMWRLASTTLLAAELSTVLALTFPHLVAVGWLDHRLRAGPVPDPQVAAR